MAELPIQASLNAVKSIYAHRRPVPKVHTPTPLDTL
jgi:hypothetical protein